MDAGGGDGSGGDGGENRGTVAGLGGPSFKTAMAEPGAGMGAGGGGGGGGGTFAPGGILLMRGFKG